MNLNELVDTVRSTPYDSEERQESPEELGFICSIYELNLVSLFFLV